VLNDRDAQDEVYNDLGLWDIQWKA